MCGDEAAVRSWNLGPLMEAQRARLHTAMMQLLLKSVGAHRGPVLVDDRA